MSSSTPFRGPSPFSPGRNMFPGLRLSVPASNDKAAPVVAPVAAPEPEILQEVTTPPSEARTAATVGSGLVEDISSPEDYRNIAPIYADYVRVQDFATKPLAGMTANLVLLSGEASLVHPFRGLRTARHAGHRLRVVMSMSDGDGKERALFVGEASLTWWADDCRNGMRVTLRLDDGGIIDGPEKHPLTGLEVGKSGEVIYLACWALDNGEKPENPEEARRAQRKPFHTLTAVQQSQIKCRNDRQFQEWCLKFVAPHLDAVLALELPHYDDSPAEYASQVVRLYCGVQSRSEFKEDTQKGLDARHRWNEMLRRFDDWQRFTN